MNTQMITQNQSNELALMGNNLTMSSLEISELVESRHDSVKRAIERLASRAVIELPPTVGVKNHLGQTVEVYVFSGDKGKRDSFVVVAQLSPEFTGALVDRWQELEIHSRLGFNPNDDIQVLEYALEQKKANRALQIELNEAKPAVQFVEKYVDGSGLMGFRQVCKTLKVKENAFREFLLEKKVMYRLNGQLTAYSHHIDADRFTVKTGINGHNGHAFADTMFTPKGVNWIAGEWAKHQIQGEL